MIQFYNKIKDEEKMKLYDKIFLLSKIRTAFFLCETFNELNELNLFYIIHPNALKIQ